MNVIVTLSVISALSLKQETLVRSWESWYIAHDEEIERGIQFKFLGWILFFFLVTPNSKNMCPHLSLAVPMQIIQIETSVSDISDATSIQRREFHLWCSKHCKMTWYEKLNSNKSLQRQYPGYSDYFSVNDFCWSYFLSKNGLELGMAKYQQEQVSKWCLCERAL